MKIDVLVAEIGSTTTVVNAFDGIRTGEPRFIGQGKSWTTVHEGDVIIGLERAAEDLKRNLGIADFTWDEMLATSSAAGGLRMSVHGLVYDMTVRAAREAALGAGAIIKLVTAGKLKRTDLAQVRSLRPNIILVAGGVDYGERDTALFNFELLAKECGGIPMIYAGNIQNREEIALLASELGVRVYITDNVYPGVDMLNVEPARKIIHNAFEEHIVHAPGMEKMRTLVDGPVIPTPGAVMLSAKLLYEAIGDLVVFDVGGATTDVHSVTEGSGSISSIMSSPEPVAKRTVEGDLGVYVNIAHVAEKIGMESLQREFPDAERLMREAKPIPESPLEVRFVERMTLACVKTALERHAGTLKDLYGPTGKITIAEGKDLTAVKTIIGTGGALTRLPEGLQILKQACGVRDSRALFPKPSAEILIDRQYIMASLGVLSLRYKDAAVALLKKSLGIGVAS